MKHNYDQIVLVIIGIVLALSAYIFLLGLDRFRKTWPQTRSFLLKYWLPIRARIEEYLFLGLTLSLMIGMSYSLRNDFEGLAPVPHGFGYPWVHSTLYRYPMQTCDIDPDNYTFNRLNWFLDYFIGAIAFAILFVSTLWITRLPRNLEYRTTIRPFTQAGWVSGFYLLLILSGLTWLNLQTVFEYSSEFSPGTLRGRRWICGETMGWPLMWSDQDWHSRMRTWYPYGCCYEDDRVANGWSIAINIVYCSAWAITLVTLREKIYWAYALRKEHAEKMAA